MELNSQKIKVLLAKKGWDTKQLSKATSLSVRTIDTFLQKKTTKLKTINKLGIILDVDPKDLLT